MYRQTLHPIIPADDLDSLNREYYASGSFLKSIYEFIYRLLDECAS
jgi:hypothetical protein